MTQATYDPDMSKWLQSGRRRDICILLLELERARGQELKTALESHYDQRLEPKAFYGSLSALVDVGDVERTPEGLHDVYSLTAVGAERTTAHATWVRSVLEDADAI